MVGSPICRLPANGPWKAVSALEGGGAKAGCSWRVLVVDDEPMVAAMYKAVLESSGHRVTTAPDAARASTALIEQDFDLVVIDITLPQMDGWEVCRRINRTYPELPVIVASGSAVDGESVREQGACVSAVLS